jgi:hypothetical protein
MKVKASSGRVEPIQANTLERRSTSGWKCGDIFVAEAAVDAVGQHHQIGVGEARLVVDVGLEHQVDAEFARALLQDQEQLAARAAAKAVAADPVHRAAEVHGDIVPIGEFLGDAAIARGSYFSKLSSVASENTTPKPKVSSARLRS